jgi:hypothetical protein
MANVETLLLKEKQKSLKSLDGDIAIVETQKLLMDRGAEDYRMLKDMGLATTLDRATDSKAAQMEHRKLDETYGEVYTLEQIKTMCCKYALKFLRSDMYKGTIDAEIPAKIRQFAKESNLDLKGTDFGRKFYIMAPQQAFVLIDRPKPEPIDPILFYKIDETHYRKVHKWGVDFSVLRQIIGWKYTHSMNYWTWWFVLVALFTMPILAILTNSILIGLTAGSIIPFIVACVNHSSAWNEAADKFILSWERNWNNNEKVEL